MINYKNKIKKIKQGAKAKEKRLKERLKERIAKIKSKPKLTPIRLLKKELWRLTSRIVRHGVTHCYTCPKKLTFTEAHAGHFWSRGAHLSVAYDLFNLRPQCNSCNLFKSGNLAVYSVKLLAEYGQEKYMALAARANIAVKWDRATLEKLIEERKIILNQLKT